MRYRPLLLALTLSLAASPSALAQPTDAHAAAEEQFRQGREALARSEYQVALGLFRRSHEIEPGRGKLLNLAICEEHLGLLIEANQHFQEVLPQLAGDERLSIAQAHLAALVPRLPHARIELARSAPPGSTVSADGAPLAQAALDTEIPLDPGKHTITVKAPSRAERRYDLTLAEGQSTTLTVEPGAALVTDDGTTATATATTTTTTTAPSSSRRTVGWIVGAAGVAGLAAGTVTGILALGDHASAVKACPLMMGCSADVVDQAKAGQALSVVSTVAFAAGAAAAGVGLYLVLSSPKAPAPTTAPTVGVTLLPGGGRLGFSSTF